jgi:hypothetical protein
LQSQRIAKPRVELITPIAFGCKFVAVFWQLLGEVDRLNGKGYLDGSAGAIQTALNETG